MSNNQAVVALMDEIKKRAKAKNASSKFKLAPVTQKLPQTEVKSPLVHSEDLQFLNTSWGDWHLKGAVSHRRILGRGIVWIKSRLRRLLFGVLMNDYIEAQTAFNQALVRYCNTSARYIDARDMEIFWDLIKKVDGDVQTVNERVDCLFEEIYAELSKVQANTKLSSRW